MMRSRQHGSALLVVTTLGGATLGCSENAVAVRLIAPAGESAHPIDYGCVNHIQVVAFGDLEPTATCIPIAAGTVDTLRDHHLSGLLDVAIPKGLFALDIRGVRSDDDQCLGDTVFHGEGFYNGGDTLDVPMKHALDCRQFSTAPMTVRLLDLAKVVANGADRCAPPTTAAGFSVHLRHQYPYDIGGGFLDIRDDRPSANAVVSTAGSATIAGPHFVGAAVPSCQTLETVTVPTTASRVTTCIDPTQPNLCAPTAPELIAITPAQGTVFGQARQNNAAISVGWVWNPTTHAAIAGATITRIDGDLALGLLMFNLTGVTVTPAAGATATTASGLFAIELGAPTTIEVSAPGHTARRLVIGAGDRTVPGVQSIPLP
jgi:hypothetical protein